MAQRNEKLDAALDECRKLGVQCRYEMTKQSHFMLFIDGVKKPVIIGGIHKRFDTRLLKNIRRDIRLALAGQSLGRNGV